MHKVIIKTVLLVTGLITCGIATAGGHGAPTLPPRSRHAPPAPPSPAIVKTAMDMQGTALIITGRNFGATPPTVMLADQVLEVRRSSEQEVVASLPRGLTAATYGVSVTTSGRNRASSNLFSATLPDID